MSRLKSQLYTQEQLVFRDHHLRYIESDDGTLFSGHHRTKILAQDLPEWYAYGRYYKRWGFMSTKGITDMLYIPHKFSNHYLKDDCLLIAYGGRIVEAAPSEDGSYYDQYTGFDERIWGNEIITILKGARKHSGYDITSFIQQLREKKDWLVNEYPDEFGPDRWSFDVDKCFSEEFDNGHPPQYFAITLDDYFSPGFCSSIKRYYGTLADVKAFIDALDYSKHKDTVDVFQEYLSGNMNALHYAAYAKHRLLEPVTFIKDTLLYTGQDAWNFENIWGFTYQMQMGSAYMKAILIKDGEQYIRCIQPTITALCYRTDSDQENIWNPVDCFWGHPGVLSIKESDKPSVRSSLYLPESRYDDVKTAVAELGAKKASLNVVCQDIFGDG